MLCIEAEHSFGVVSEEIVIGIDTDTDVEIIDVEGARIEVVDESDEEDDGENEELMGFHFNEGRNTLINTLSAGNVK